MTNLADTAIQDPSTVQEQSTNGTPPAATRPYPEIDIQPQDSHNVVLIKNAHTPSWQNPTPDGVYNLVVIGGGSAGLVAASGAAGLGAKVALIESEFLGGDCLNVGCVPSKSLIRPAKIIGEIQRAASMGVDVPEGTTVDFDKVMKRMRTIRAEISHHDSFQRFKDLGIDVYQGRGHFTGPETVEVVRGDEKIALSFKKALISTGSRPMHLPIPGLAEAGYLTNESLFRSEFARPKRLAIIGAGPIGAEMAQSFRRFGSEVTVFDIVPRLLGREDEEAAEVIRHVFEQEGVQLALGAKTQEILLDGDDKVIKYELDGENRELRVDEILVSAGRIPNIDKLNLEAAGVEYHKKGVTVDDTMVTTNPNVYAAGDIAYKFQFTHTADATARIVLQNALFPGPKKKVSNLTVPWTTYTDPEVAHVGMYQQDAEEQGIAVETYRQSIGDVDRGKTDGDRESFVKIHVKKGTDKILGATIVAPHAGEMISEITTAMVGGIGLKTMATVIHPYPTQAEAIKKIADAYNRTRMTPMIQRLFRWWMAWSRR